MESQASVFGRAYYEGLIKSLKELKKFQWRETNKKRGLSLPFFIVSLPSKFIHDILKRYWNLEWKEADSGFLAFHQTGQVFFAG